MCKRRVYGTCPLGVLLKSKICMAVKHPATELIAINTKLPKGKRWAFTVDIRFPHFLHLGDAQSSKLWRLINCPSQYDGDRTEVINEQ